MLNVPLAETRNRLSEFILPDSRGLSTQKATLRERLTHDSRHS